MSYYNCFGKVKKGNISIWLVALVGRSFVKQQTPVVGYESINIQFDQNKVLKIDNNIVKP